MATRGRAGSDDAIVSTASFMIGVAASAASTSAILFAGVAGLVAGSTSMAVGEYVSVSSQRDAEQADIALEQSELLRQPTDLRSYSIRADRRQLVGAAADQLVVVLPEA